MSATSKVYGVVLVRLRLGWSCNGIIKRVGVIDAERGADPEGDIVVVEGVACQHRPCCGVPGIQGRFGINAVQVTVVREGAVRYLRTRPIYVEDGFVGVATIGKDSV